MRKKNILQERESKILELKSSLPKFEALIKTCVAFANGIGGRIIIGVEDSTGEVCGIDEHTRKRIYDEFPNSLYDSTTPSLLAQIYEKNFNDYSVIIIKIPQNLKKPCFITREGIPKGVYLRVGSSTRRATQEYIEDLMRESKRISYDEEQIHEPSSILSKDLLKMIYSNSPTKKRLLSDRVISESAANQELYYPTVAGIMHFCENPELYIPEAVILCTQFQGNSGREIIQTQEIHGNLEQQASVSIKLVESWISRHFTLQGVRLSGKSIIPHQALREAIINALIHRKYFIPGAIKIAVYDNRIEIFSPGGFPGLVDVHHLGDGITFLRNPSIAHLARKFKMIEKLGTGIKLIISSCKKAGLRTPEFHEEGDFVKVIFYFQKVKESEVSDEEAIVSLVRTKNHLTVADVMEYLNVSRNTATRKLNKLIDKKKLLRVGKGPAVRYILL